MADGDLSRVLPYLPAELGSAATLIFIHSPTGLYLVGFCFLEKDMKINT